MTVFEFDALAPLRTGRYADAATALAWLVGLVSVGAGFWWEVSVRTFVVGNLLGVSLGLAVAGGFLGVAASSVSRAVASGFSFGVTVVVAGVVLWVVAGDPPALVSTAPAGIGVVGSAVAAVAVPAAVGALVRFLS